MDTSERRQTAISPLPVLIARLVRAARLDSTLYEEVEADRRGTTDALVVVLFTATMASLGDGLRAVVTGEGNLVLSLVGGVASATIFWVGWAAILYLVGVKVLGGTSTPGELLRTTAYAQAPNALLVLSGVSGFGTTLWMAVSIWVVASSVVAVRQALDVSTMKAVVATVIGWGAMAVAVVVVVAIPALLFAP